jgi:hypothetical protein
MAWPILLGCPAAGASCDPPLPPPQPASIAATTLAPNAYCVNLEMLIGKFRPFLSSKCNCVRRYCAERLL